MLKNKVIQNGIYEIKDISFLQKTFPLIVSYMKCDIRFTILMFIPLLAIIYICFAHTQSLVNKIQYIMGIIIIEFIMFFAMSRLLIVKNKKKQYLKISGNIVKLIANDFSKIDGYKVFEEKTRIYRTSNIITIILEEHGSRRHRNIKNAITFPSNCIENKVLDINIKNSIEKKEQEIYNDIMKDNEKFDLDKMKSIRDMVENERQDFNTRNNIK